MFRPFARILREFAFCYKFCIHMHVDRTTIENSSLGEHHMVWNAKTKLYTDELKYRVPAIWNIYPLDAALPKEFSTVAVQEKKNYWGKRLLCWFKTFTELHTVKCEFSFQTFFFCKDPCKRTQHCWMLHVASVCTPCCMLLRKAVSYTHLTLPTIYSV